MACCNPALEVILVDVQKFISLPVSEVAALVRQAGPLVCAFPINGTRRWFLLEYPPETWQSDDFLSAYLNASFERQLELFRLFIDHGVDTLMMPLFGPDLLERGEGYLYMAASGLRQLAEDPLFLDFYHKNNVRVRFYGDHRRFLKNTPYAELSDLFDNVARLTSGNTGSRLLFGVFGHDPAETVAELGVRYYNQYQRLPDKHALVEMYYGEYIPPVSIFIGFDRFSSFDMPLVATGNEDLYFTVAPSSYLDENQLRMILFDHLFTRRVKEPDYEKLTPEAMEWMRNFYHTNRSAIQGTGFVRDGFWYPAPQVRLPGYDHLPLAGVEPDLQHEVKRLLTEWSPGCGVMRTAYDTAWVARLDDMAPDLSNAALDWICENQLPDGSWGAPELFYYHDRVISTLAAMNALNGRGRRSGDQKQIEMGLQALERFASGGTTGMISDPDRATVGFEMIVPTLVAEAERLGIVQRQGDRILGRLQKLRAAKMARLNGFKISRHLTIAYSTEMAGPDFQHMIDLENIQEANGSIAYNPSSTAYYAMNVMPGDPAAIQYLRGITTPCGGLPMAAPFDVYERAWVLWNLMLTGPLDEETRRLCEPHLQALARSWQAGRGIGFGDGYSVLDGDDTSLVYAVLTAFGYAVDADALYHYEEPGHFRCFELETNPSISANVHMLEAFRQAGLEGDHPTVQKILHFIRSHQIEGRYWMDKWHASPYYTTAHVAISARQYDRQLAKTAIDWIVDTRRADGSWGYYLSTAEETAYALQALCLWERSGGAVPREVIRQGADWLLDHFDPPYPPLWIAKTLFYSEWVIRAEIISALLLAR